MSVQRKATNDGGFPLFVFKKEAKREMVKINGELKNADGKTLNEYLSENGYNILRVAAEKNGEVVPKSEYEHTVLSDGDVIEIVQFVGGG